MAIYVVDGYAGSGKTAYSVKWCRSLLLRGERVFSNIKLYPEQMHKKFVGKDIEGDIDNPDDRDNPEKLLLYWRNFDDWIHMKNGTIFCDEGIIYFNPRNWATLPEEVQTKLVQHRHEKLDLITTVVHWSRVDVMLRIMCERFVNVDLLIGSKKLKKTILPRIAKVREFNLENLQRQENLAMQKDYENYEKEALWSEWFWIRPKMFSWYNTAELVSTSRPPKLHKLCDIHKVYYCKFCELGI